MKVTDPAVVAEFVLGALAFAVLIGFVVVIGVWG